MNMTHFNVPASEQEFDQVRHLFREYAASIDFEAGFPGFEQELKTLGIDYSHPNGVLVLAYQEDKPVGCVGIKKISDELAELKRFYVQPAFRQFRIGRRLLALVLEKAGELKLKSVRLEVIPTLTKAKALYEAFGFGEIVPYKSIDVEGTVFMERSINNEPIRPTGASVLTAVTHGTTVNPSAYPGGSV